MPRLKWLIFQVPMSSPHRIRIFGCFVAMIFSFLVVSFVLQLLAYAGEKRIEGRNAPSKCHLITPCTPPGDARGDNSACIGMPRPSCGVNVVPSNALNGDSGSRLPWQKRNFLPLPQEQS